AGTDATGTDTAGAAGADPNLASSQTPGATQVWLSEPNGLAEVPWSGAGLPLDRHLKRDGQGQLRHDGSVGVRKLYSLAAEPALAAWRRQAPTAQDLQMAAGTNPRLETLAAGWRRQGSGGAKAVEGAKAVALAEAWFRQQGFRYSLSNPRLPETAPLDALLFEQRQGFCGHYASALSALMRAAGVPARVVSGYRGGTWVVPLGGSAFLDLRQSCCSACWGLTGTGRGPCCWWRWP
ncbi:MAG: transglutaminase-like domain-containing protein, partial [Cyanobacteria bacterium]|nr:transglutaminase-like domain-containing protein [Cyanobacteriota bacterium]